MKIREVIPIINFLSGINQNVLPINIREKLIYNYMQLLPYDNENTIAFVAYQKSVVDNNLTPTEAEHTTAAAAYRAIRDKEVQVELKKLSMSEIQILADKVKEFPIGNYMILLPMIEK